MLGIMISLILIVLAIITPIAMITVKKYEEMFMIVSWIITALAFINLILILFNVY